MMMMMTHRNVRADLTVCMARALPGVVQSHRNLIATRQA